MARKPRPSFDIDRLCTMRVISERLDVPRGTLDAWAYNDSYSKLKFPEPIIPGYPNLYDWHDIERWCAIHRPELLLPPDERKRAERDRERRQRQAEKMQRLNARHKHLPNLSKREIREMAKGWREQGKSMSEYLKLELLRRGYRWYKKDGKTEDEEKFSNAMRQVIMETRRYRETGPDKR